MQNSKRGGRDLRVGEQIKRILATIITQEVRDHNLHLVSITAVKVSPDLQIAKIYVTSLDVEINSDATEAQNLIIQTLNKAKGFLRARLGNTIKLRRVPELHFIYDESIAYAKNMEALINRAIYPK